MTEMKLLDGITVISLAVNLPGPAAARRLVSFGARVIKIEPPQGDPMQGFLPHWYTELNSDQEILSLNLKEEEARRKLDMLLGKADLLVTSNRPAALDRLGLGWSSLHQKFPDLCQVAIVGYPAPRENEPGHDLTYQAENGLITPPHLPKSLIADLAGAEMAVSAALALLLAKERGLGAGYEMIALSDAAEYMAEPYRTGFTSEGAIVGGGLPEYNLYETADGWIAVAALEPHFKRKMADALALIDVSSDELKSVFKTKSAVDWGVWAQQLDLPIVALEGA
jgi:alpha-methylacyl-CoA racemase